MPEDLKLSQLGSSLRPPPFRGTSLSRSTKTLSNYLRLLFPEIVYFLRLGNFVVFTFAVRALHVGRPSNTELPPQPAVHVRSEAVEQWTCSVTQRLHVPNGCWHNCGCHQCVCQFASLTPYRLNPHRNYLWTAATLRARNQRWDYRLRWMVPHCCPAVQLVACHTLLGTVPCVHSLELGERQLDIGYCLVKVWLWVFLLH